MSVYLFKFHRFFIRVYTVIVIKWLTNYTFDHDWNTRRWQTSRRAIRVAHNIDYCVKCWAHRNFRKIIPFCFLECFPTICGPPTLCLIIYYLCSKICTRNRCNHNVYNIVTLDLSGIDFNSTIISCLKSKRFTVQWNVHTTNFDVIKLST